MQRKVHYPMHCSRLVHCTSAKTPKCNTGIKYIIIQQWKPSNAMEQWLEICIYIAPKCGFAQFQWEPSYKDQLYITAKFGNNQPNPIETKSYFDHFKCIDVYWIHLYAYMPIDIYRYCLQYFQPCISNWMQGTTGAERRTHPNTPHPPASMINCQKIILCRAKITMLRHIS